MTPTGQRERRMRTTRRAEDGQMGRIHSLHEGLLARLPLSTAARVALDRRLPSSIGRQGTQRGEQSNGLQAAETQRPKEAKERDSGLDVVKVESMTCRTS